MAYSSGIFSWLHAFHTQFPPSTLNMPSPHVLLPCSGRPSPLWPYPGPTKHLQLSHILHHMSCRSPSSCTPAYALPFPTSQPTNAHSCTLFRLLSLWCGFGTVSDLLLLPPCFLLQRSRPGCSKSSHSPSSSSSTTPMPVRPALHHLRNSSPPHNPAFCFLARSHTPDSIRPPQMDKTNTAQTKTTATTAGTNRRWFLHGICA